MPGRPAPLGAAPNTTLTKDEANALNTNRSGTVQVTALSALARLAQDNPGLPGGYITVHTGDPLDGAVRVRVDSPADFEAWRVALGWLPESVALKAHGTSVWLEAEDEFFGAPIEVSTFSVPLSVEVAKVSFAAHQAALLVQHHQLDDPAEPPAAFRDDALVSLPVSAWSAQVPA